MYRAIVIGVSTGGIIALSTIISALPKNFRLAIIVVQHLNENSEPYLSEYLNQKSALSVKEADEKEPILAGTVYIAPAGYHLLIEKEEIFSLSMEPPLNYSRPSIDILFESAAEVYEQQLIGLILTGANSDGSNGLKKIKDFGGLTIVENPKTALSPFMPQFAIKTLQVDHILALKEIGPFLKDLIGEKYDTP